MARAHEAPATLLALVTALSLCAAQAAAQLPEFGDDEPVEITADRIEEHRMHGERYVVDPGTWARIEAADRVVAVGTTVVRTLESVAASGELAATTELFITRDHEWRVVDTLLTNFHVPRSSLLVLSASSA